MQKMMINSIFPKKQHGCMINFLGTTRVLCGETLIEIKDKRTTILLLLLVIKKKSSRKFLAALLWEGLPTERALANLRNHLYKNRKIFTEVIDARGAELSLGKHVQSDIDFLLVNDSPTPDIALRAHVNHFLNGEDFSDFPSADLYVKRLLEDYKSKSINTIYQQIKVCLANHRVSQAITLARRILLIAPLSESAVRLLLQLYVKNGDRAAALEIYERFRSSLRSTFGVEPEQKTRQLHRSLLLDQRNQAGFDNDFNEISNDTII